MPSKPRKSTRGNAEKRELAIKNSETFALILLGASKGGKARAAKLSAARRKAIAEKAARARWSKKQ